MKMLLCLVLAALLAGGTGPAASGQFHAAPVPSSPRSARAEREATVRLMPRLKAQALALGVPVCMRIFKEERVLEVWLRDPSGRFRLFASYPICAFSGGLGPKLRTGDGQSPEGFYLVRPAALNPNSAFHLSFDLGYPNAYDRANGRTGSALMVHGSCVSIGCYAMTDRGIEEIWTCAATAFRNGQRDIQVQVFPFRMTDTALDRHRRDRWYPFWTDLKKGHDLFETIGVPPRVEVQAGRYRFAAAVEEARSPTAVVERFYATYLRVWDGALPSGPQLERLRPFLSDNLNALILGALRHREAFIASHPDEPQPSGPPVRSKPPFADGDYFSSNGPEGFKSFKVVRAVEGPKDTWTVYVHFWYDPRLEGWEDRVVVIRQRGQYMIDDVLYAGSSPSTPGGRLSEVLKRREPGPRRP